MDCSKSGTADSHYSDSLYNFIVPANKHLWLEQLYIDIF